MIDLDWLRCERRWLRGRGGGNGHVRQTVGGWIVVVAALV